MDTRSAEGVPGDALEGGSLKDLRQPLPVVIVIGNRAEHLPASAKTVLLVRCDTCGNWFGFSANDLTMEGIALKKHWPGWDLWKGSKGPEQHCEECSKNRAPSECEHR